MEVAVVAVVVVKYKSFFLYAYIHDEHTSTFILYKDYDTPGKHCNLCTPGAIWAIQHLTDTSTFEDHWSHDLHDLAERRLILLRYNLQTRRGIEPRVALMKIANRLAMHKII